VDTLVVDMEKEDKLVEALHRRKAADGTDE
jgi:hypothetical protein